MVSPRKRPPVATHTNESRRLGTRLAVTSEGLGGRDIGAGTQPREKFTLGYMEPWRQDKLNDVFSKWDRRGNSGKNRSRGTKPKDFGTRSPNQQASRVRDNPASRPLIKNHNQLPENRVARYRRRLEHKKHTVVAHA